MGWKWHEMEPSLRMRFQKALNDELEDHSKASGSKPKRTVRHEPLAKAPGKEENPGRIRIGVCSFRKRLADPDNLSPKYFIDCLRYWKYIPDDSAKHIELSISQVKCDKKDERTEIEIIYPD